MNKYKILIVEDDILTAENIKMTIEDHGHTAITTPSGHSALELVKINIPHLVIMDIQLAGSIDGITTARCINSICTVPIIFLTMLRENEIFKRATEVFPFSFITKPFDEITLIRAVDLALHNFYTEDTETFRYIKKDTIDSIFVLYNNSNFYRKIMLGDILFIEASGNYSNIYLKINKDIIETGTTKNKQSPTNKDAQYNSITVSISSNNVVKQMKHPDIVKINRSYYANVNMIDAIQGSTIKILDKEMTVGNDCKDDLMARVRILKHPSKK
jgi:DNA-binding response OmpR family regulator